MKIKLFESFSDELGSIEDLLSNISDNVEVKTHNRGNGFYHVVISDYIKFPAKNLNDIDFNINSMNEIKQFLIRIEDKYDIQYSVELLKEERETDIHIKIAFRGEESSNIFSIEKESLKINGPLLKKSIESNIGDIKITNIWNKSRAYKYSFKINVEFDNIPTLLEEKTTIENIRKFIFGNLSTLDENFDIYDFEYEIENRSDDDKSLEVAFNLYEFKNDGGSLEIIISPEII